MSTDTKIEMTPEEIDAVRVEVRAVMEGDAVTMVTCAREAGVAYGTFSSWMGCTYAGRNDKIAGQVRNWLRARKVKAETQALAPAAPRFVQTPSAEAFQLVFQHAQHMPDFAVVVGAPGVGKSSAACAYTRSNPNVFKIVANPMLGTPRAVLEEFTRVIGTFQGGALHKVQRALIAKLRGTGALLMVDEAQHLSSVALDQVRSIHDEAEIGVVLLGNPAIYGRLEGGGARRSDFAQLFSRVGMRISRKAPEKGDIEALLDAWAIEGEPERRFLQGVAKKPGALRSMTKTLKLAHMLAAVAKMRPDLSHLRDAYAQLGATDLSVGEAG
jgi:DNA transposition AAA+ family ATPase